MAKKCTISNEESLFPEEKKSKKEVLAKRRITFSLKAKAGDKVFVAGTFNDWSVSATPLKDVQGDGTFSCTKFLPVGRYEYKFIVNGVWDVDASNPDFAVNDFGTMNSVLEVK